MVTLNLPGYKNLKVWQMAYELAGLIYQSTRAFPNGHYRLIDQMIGAATGVYGNIAEGYCRNSLPAYINSCDIARGELGELTGYIKHSEDNALIAGEMADRINTLGNNLWPALGGLIISLEKKRKAGDWDKNFGV